MKIILKSNDQIIMSSDDVRNVKQSIFCGKKGQCLRDSNGKVYVETEKKLQIHIDCTDQAVPSLLGEYIGQEFIIWCDQRLYEDINPSLADVKNDNAANVNTLRYTYQKNTLAVHQADEPMIDEKTELKQYKTKLDFVDLIPNKGLVSYKPIINGVLSSFAMNTNDDLTSTCLMIFEEQ